MRLAGDDVAVGGAGTDPDADVAGLALNFLGPDGRLLDIYGDGEATRDGDVFVVPFDPAPRTAAYDALQVVRASAVNLGPYMRAARVSRGMLRAFDRAYALSDELEVTVGEASLVGWNEACDGERVCRDPMTCVRGLCDVTGLPAAVCRSARLLVLPTPTDEATSVGATGTVGSGRVGAFFATCAGGQASLGTETVFLLSVPEGRHDLLATTDLSGSGSTDTILYLRRACGDSGTEIACNDDISRTNTQSAIEVRDAMPGNYFLFVELYGGASAAPFELRVTLRPVREAGQSCDEAGLANRCASGACVGGVCAP